MINIYAITWNDKINLSYWYIFYKSRFSNPRFTIFDNNSTDGTKELAQVLNVNIINFDSNNKFDDRIHRDIKNKLFHQEFIIISDIDEYLHINEDDLLKERTNNVTIIRSKGFDIFEDSYKLRNPKYDKYICFNSNKVEMNYDYGGHNIFPLGEVKYSSKEYELWHNKYISEDYYINRTKLYQERFEEWNKSVGHGKEYFKTEEELRNNYRKLKRKAIKII